MKVWLNGHEHELRDGATLADAVAAAGSPAMHQGVAAAVDGEVVPRERWTALELGQGQRIEVVQAVQGG